MSMSRGATTIKNHTLEMYQGLVESYGDSYLDMLCVAQEQPNSYWEEQALAQAYIKNIEAW